MSIDQILQKLGSETGLGNLKLDAIGTCTLRFEGKHVIVIELPVESKYLYIYTMLFKLPDAGREPIYARLLEANLFGKDTGQAFFSCNPKTQEVFLTRTLEAEGTEYSCFKVALEELLNCIDFWREKYENGYLLNSTDSTPTTDEDLEKLPPESRFV